MGKAADWLREERRNVLGHWTAFCLDCGAARRWFLEFEEQVPETCRCGGRMLRRCPACMAPFSSTFAVDCEECGARLRDPELLGIPIRKAGSGVGSTEPPRSAGAGVDGAGAEK